MNKQYFRPFRAIRWCLLIVLTHTLSAQQPAAGFIQGVVIDSSSNMPVSKVTVELRTPGSAPALGSTLTDTDGRFFLANVKPGAYRIVAMRTGYASSEFGQRRTGGPSQSVSIAPGQRVNDLRIAMTRAGSVSGHVLDNGAPVGIADVLAIKVTYIEGQPGFSLVLTSRTDDRGEYHLFWLPPGKYLIMAIVWDTASSAPYYMTPDGSNDNTFVTSRRTLRAVFNRASGSGAAENEAHVPFFYPNTPDPRNATVLDIRPGSDLRNLDINENALPTRHVRGSLTGALPPPNPNALRAGVPAGPMVRLIPLQSVLNTNEAQSPSVNADANGSFEFKSVIAGRYMLVATAGTLTGSVPVEIRERDIDGISVALVPGLTVSGQVVFDGAAAGTPPIPPGLRIMLRPEPLVAGLPTYTGTAAANGSFTIPPLPPAPPVAPGGAAAAAPAAPAVVRPPTTPSPPSGLYRVIIQPIMALPVPPDAAQPVLPPALRNIYVKSIRIGESDVLKDGLSLDHAIDDLKIVIGSNPGSLEGHVLNDQRQPVASAVVALVPDNELRYHINHRWVPSDASGAFQFQAVAPGDYLLFAWESIENGGWQDAGVLRDYESQGKRVHVDEGGKITLDLVSIPARN